MKAIIKLDVPEYQIGQEVSIYFKDTMMIKGVVQKPKTGHLIRWYENIERENCTIHDPHCKCSECDQEYDPYNASLFNYCPNCGAKMEVEEK